MTWSWKISFSQTGLGQQIPVYRFGSQPDVTWASPEKASIPSSVDWYKRTGPTGRLKKRQDEWYRISREPSKFCVERVNGQRSSSLKKTTTHSKEGSFSWGGVHKRPDRQYLYRNTERMRWCLILGMWLMELTAWAQAPPVLPGKPAEPVVSQFDRRVAGNSLATDRPQKQVQPQTPQPRLSKYKSGHLIQNRIQMPKRSQATVLVLIFLVRHWGLCCS